MVLQKQLEELYGLVNVKEVYRNLPVSRLYEEVIRNGEGVISENGAIAVLTGKYTGRTPENRFIVKQEPSETDIDWGKINKPFPPESFYKLYHRLLAYLENKKLYVMDVFAGADKKYSLPLRVITTQAWQALFVYNMFIRIDDEEVLQNFVPEVTVIAAPDFQANPKIDGTSSEAFIILNIEKGLIIIGGTGYAGEIKKSVFSMLNYLLPKRGILTMHCSANVGPKGDVAIFFGLSGTGKTTLSADPERYLIGDDEHAWSDEGVFNLEGGCYAKVIKLSAENEPVIYQAVNRFGAIMENVVIDPETRRVNFDDDSITENTRASYPIYFVPNAVLSGKAGHPSNVIMLTYDAFGVLPPIAKLTPEQAIYHFLSGYTAKVAGTELGIVEPVATFSSCFGAPFMILDPVYYAKMLEEKIKKYNVQVWLVNTGHIGGAYGHAKRISIQYSRNIIKAITNGDLNKVEYYEDPVFGFLIPKSCPGVPSEILDQRNLWQNKEEFEKELRKLAERFKENFKKFEKRVDERILKAGPRV